jgi:hypothetical protein
MAEKLEIKGVSKKLQNSLFRNQDVVYLTLGDLNSESQNRYFVSIKGLDAKSDWQEGDRILVKLSLLANRNNGQWKKSHCPDSIELIEIGIKNDNQLNI